jgi:hypothetical protein
MFCSLQPLLGSPPEQQGPQPQWSDRDGYERRRACHQTPYPDQENALFTGSDGGAERWAIAMTLIQTAKLNGVDPQAWLTDVLERIVARQIKANELHKLLPWHWTPTIAETDGSKQPDRPISSALYYQANQAWSPLLCLQASAAILMRANLSGATLDGQTRLDEACGMPRSRQ